MDERLQIAFTGAITYSVMYLTCVICIGIFTQHNLAWKLALAAAGVTYLSYFWMARSTEKLQLACVALSVLLGGAAGVALLV